MDPSDPVSVPPTTRPSQVDLRDARSVCGSFRNLKHLCFTFVFCCTLGLLTGCSMDFGKLAGRPDTPFWDVDNIKGPLAPSSIGLMSGKDQKSRNREKLLMSGQGEKELEAAVQMYEDGKRNDAVKKYASIAKRYNETTTGEEAQFRYATAMYKANVFAKASDAYTQLLTDYPSTRYMDDSTKRLFRISRYWLDLTSDTPSGEILQASAEVEQTEKPTKRSSDPSLKVSVLPNMFDKTRPTFDTSGRALAALRTIWLSDPTGDLADDALMITASHYLQKRDFVEADRYFQILRDEYPRSPHLEQAFARGSQVKLASYQGALYDGTPLAAAEKLTEQQLRLFPDGENRQRLKNDLTAISEASAARAWEDVEYYRKKKNPAGMAVCCQQVIENHPNSKYAAQARQVIKSLDPKDIGHLPLNIPPERPEPSDTRPYEE